MVRQFADEPDRVGEEHLREARHLQATGGGVEGGEELVLGQHRRAGQAVEEGRLASVGVADEGDAEGIPPPLGLGLPLDRDPFEQPLELADLLADATAVDLELCLARSARPDAAAGAREVSPHAGQARQQVAQLRQLHLQLRLPRAGSLREDVEDQLAAIDDADLERLFEIAHLRGTQVLVAD